MVEPTNVPVFSSQMLKECTNNFSQINLIGLTQFGILFRGTLQGQHFLVKIWDHTKLDPISTKYNDEYLIIKEEVKFWTDPNLRDCPYLANLIGYTWERDIKGVVYDINPLDTLYNAIQKAETDSLNWLQRVNVIDELAKLLKFIHDHEKQNMVFNITASHILLDKDYKPKLFDLLLLSEVKLLKEKLTSSYMDPYFSLRGGEWDRSCEVFSFGIILLELITKRISNIDTSLDMESAVHIWAKKEYKPNTSLVHNHLQKDWLYCDEDGVAITLLAMQCIEFFPANRPSMKDILQRIENLLVLQHLSDARPRKREKI